MWTYMDTYQPLEAVSALPAAGFGDLNKMTPLDLLSMYIVNLVIFCQLLASLDVFVKKWTFCSNDYAS